MLTGARASGLTAAGTRTVVILPRGRPCFHLCLQLSRMMTSTVEAGLLTRAYYVVRPALSSTVLVAPQDTGAAQTSRDNLVKNLLSRSFLPSTLFRSVDGLSSRSGRSFSVKFPDWCTIVIKPLEASSRDSAVVPVPASISRVPSNVITPLQL